MPAASKNEPEIISYKYTSNIMVSFVSMRYRGNRFCYAECWFFLILFSFITIKAIATPSRHQEIKDFQEPYRMGRLESENQNGAFGMWIVIARGLFIFFLSYIKEMVLSPGLWVCVGGFVYVLLHALMKFWKEHSPHSWNGSQLPFLWDCEWSQLLIGKRNEIGYDCRP